MAHGRVSIDHSEVILRLAATTWGNKKRRAPKLAALDAAAYDDQAGGPRMGDYPETVDLAYIGHALQRLTTEVATLRDDVNVMAAIIPDASDNNQDQIFDQLRAMHGQHERMADQVETTRREISLLSLLNQAHYRQAGLEPATLSPEAQKLAGCENRFAESAKFRSKVCRLRSQQRKSHGNCST